MTFPFTPIADNDVKCRISEGCFFALGSMAGFELQKVPKENDCGVDFRLIKTYSRKGKLRDGSIVLDFQLKSTVNWALKNNYIEYSVETKTYNDITDRNKDGSIPLVLIIMFLPQVRENWVVICDDDMTFQHSLYWYHTESKIPLSNENSKKLIKIPTANLLTKSSLIKLVNMHCVKQK
jgi:hypothetical protein